MESRWAGVTAVLLHSDESCFGFPFCGHDVGSRVDSVARALRGRNGNVVTVTEMHGVFLADAEGRMLWLQMPSV